jgi:hypothetical protein
MMKRGEKGPGFGFLTAGDGKKMQQSAIGVMDDFVGTSPTGCAYVQRRCGRNTKKRNEPDTGGFGGAGDIRDDGS